MEQKTGWWLWVDVCDKNINYQSQECVDVLNNHLKVHKRLNLGLYLLPVFLYTDYFTAITNIISTKSQKQTSAKS